MMTEGFVTVLLIVAVLVVATAAVVFLRPMERLVNRLTRSRARGNTGTPPSAGVLWVDDRPEHNARLLNGLRAQGVPVDVAQTTSEALTHLGLQDYAIVVSDMSSVEQPGDGLPELEKASGATPVVVFSRYASTADTYRDRGVTVVSSEAEIKECLRAVDLLR